jgi:transcriptional regulator with XRE-family HTH domain
MATEIGKLVRQLRTERGITQAQLAEWTGVSRSHLAQVELGRRKPSEKVARALGIALGLSLYEVYSTAGFLSETERDVADAVVDDALDSGLSLDAALYLRDQMLLTGGTIGVSIDGNREEMMRIVPRRPAGLIGWEKLTPAHRHVVQEIVTGFLAGYPTKG